MNTLRLMLLLAWVAVAGCSLEATPFAGTVIQLTLENTNLSHSGQHFELWAHRSSVGVVRLQTLYDAPDPNNPKQTIALNPYGFMVRPAISLADPCMIDDAGNLLTSAAAYPDTITVEGVRQSPAEQAAATIARVAQITAATDCDGATPPHCGIQGATLHAVLPYTDALPPTLPFDTAPADRLAACQAYWQDSLAYTPNPMQLTAPLHGTVYGFPAYITFTPTAGYDGVRLDTPTNLSDIDQFWITLESHPFDPDHIGPVYLAGTRDRGGNDVIHFALSPPPGSDFSDSGTAAMIVPNSQSLDF